MNTDPKTVERLREMMEGAAPQNRAESTVLWAADEIDRLRARVGETPMTRAELDSIASRNGYALVADNQAVYDGVVYELEPSLGHEGYFLLRTIGETP